jgi:hypothetical protein
MALAAADPIRQDVEAVSRISAVPTILRVVSEVSGLRFSVVARVTQDQWVACAVHDEMSFGLGPGDTLDVTTTLCSEVRDSHVPVVINHASVDPHYCGHPTPKMYGLESYIAVPIFLANGEYFGNVCAMDPLPHHVDQPKILGMMKLFGELIALQLDAEARQAATHAQLLDAQETSQLREQFIAVLGHDLRNPLSSVNMGAELLLREPLADRQRNTVERIWSSGRRMSGLVGHLLDFARARLGGGIGLALADVTDLDSALRHVVAELQSVHPRRELRFSSEIAGRVRCDRERVAQLLSNLVANAIEHGATDRPIDVQVRQSGSGLRIAVRNDGPPIPGATIPLLFRPYSRGGRESPKGLGLGLYIASEIAKAHGGTLTVRSNADEGTVFTFALGKGTAPH